MRNTLITFALSLSFPIAASATTYNVVTDFSTASNPNGVWTYGSGTPTSFTPYSYNGTNFGPGYGFTYWSTGPNSLPGVGANGTPYGSVDVPSNQLFMHPGPDAGEDSIVEFTAPTTGLYTISATFYHDDTAGTSGGYSTGQFVSIGENGVAFDTELLTTTYGDSFTFSGYGPLAQGDVLFFDVSKNGAYYNDSTGLELTISTGATPEPSSLVLLGTGILGLAGAARRRVRG